MNVHFIYPNMNDRENLKGDVHFGLASLSAVLKAEGHRVTLTHLKHPDAARFVEKTISDIKRYNPEIIGFSLTELDEPAFRILSGRLKEEFGLPLVAGGAYPTIAPEEIIRAPGVDIVVRGEAENVLKNLLESMERKKPIDELRGVWSRKKGKIYRNELDHPPDITKLPPMDFSIFDDETIVGKKFDGKTKLGYLSNRGCPFQCTYCINFHLKSCYPAGGKYIRYQNVDKVIMDLTDLKDRYRFELINFYDDTFLMNRKWVNEFSSKYEKAVGLPFICNARPETSTRALISMVAKAGCTCLLIGIESGNERLRMGVLKRNVTNAQIIKAFELAREFGLRTYTYNMVGIPYETEKDILDTIKLNARVRPYIGGVSAFYPFKGTQLGELCYEKGWVMKEKKDKIRSFIEGSIVDYPQLSNKMIEWYLRNFDILYVGKTDRRGFIFAVLTRLLKHYRISGRLQLRSKIFGAQEMTSNRVVTLDDQGAKERLS